MDITLLFLAGFYSLVTLAAITVFIQRLRTQRTKPKRRSKWGYFPIAAAIAFQQLNAIVHPHQEYVMQAMYDESADEDAEGAPRDPIAHLLRQAEKIQKGEKIDRLTVIVNSSPCNDN